MSRVIVLVWLDEGGIYREGMFTCHPQITVHRTEQEVEAQVARHKADCAETWNVDADPDDEPFVPQRGEDFDWYTIEQELDDG